MNWYFRKKDYGCWILTLDFGRGQIEFWQPEYWYKPWKWRIGFQIDLTNKHADLCLGVFFINLRVWEKYDY